MTRTALVLAAFGLLSGSAHAGSAADFARNFGRMAAPGITGYGNSQSPVRPRDGEGLAPGPRPGAVYGPRHRRLLRHR